jgi:hypothetical protein
MYQLLPKEEVTKEFFAGCNFEKPPWVSNP